MFRRCWDATEGGSKMDSARYVERREDYVFEAHWGVWKQNETVGLEVFR